MTNDPSAKPRASSLVSSVETHGRHYESRRVDCGKVNCQKCGGAGFRRASHGPYWYLCYTYKGRWYRRYLGKNLDTSRFVTDAGNLDMGALLSAQRHKRLQPLEQSHEAPGQLNALEHQGPDIPAAGDDPADVAGMGPPIPRQDPEDLKPPPRAVLNASVRAWIHDRIHFPTADAQVLPPNAPSPPAPPAPLEDPDDPGPIPPDID